MTSPGQKAKHTAKWATTMTKWLVTSCRSRVRWQLVEFTGPEGGESRGIVDVLAIRKNHSAATAPLKRGDLFEMVLIQIKGGSARWPSRSDVQRLRVVARHHRARDVVLADWKKGGQPALCRLKKVLPRGNARRSFWVPVEAAAVFG